MILTTLPLHTGNAIRSYCWPISITILKNGNNFLRNPVFILYGLEGLLLSCRIRHVLGCLVGRLVGRLVRRIAFGNERTLFCAAGRALALNRDVLYRDALNRAALNRAAHNRAALNRLALNLLPLHERTLCAAGRALALNRDVLYRDALNRAALNRAALAANKRALLRPVARALIRNRPLPTAERQPPEK